MMHPAEQKLQAQAWVVSAVLHGLIASLAIAVMGQIKPLPMKELFEWEVSMVQPVAQEAKAQPAQKTPPAPAPKSQPKAFPPVEPVPQIVARQVQTIEKPAAVQRAVQQIVEAVRPIEEAIKPIERTVAVRERAAVTSEPQEIEGAQIQERPAEQVVQAETMQERVHTTPASAVLAAPAPVTASVRAIEHVATVEASSIVQSEPIRHAAPAVAHQPVVQPVVEETAAPVVAANPPASQSDSPLPPVSAPVEPSATTVPVQAQSPAPLAAKASPVRPATKADNAWLAESLGRRIKELTRYPSAARLNGSEGKVVLRVILRADGHLADVTVHRSSGHEVLDRAAMETVRLACPIHMKQALSAAEVAVYVPIVYSLAG